MINFTLSIEALSIHIIDRFIILKKVETKFLPQESIEKFKRFPKDFFRIENIISFLKVHLYFNLLFLNSYRSN